MFYTMDKLNEFLGQFEPSKYKLIKERKFNNETQEREVVEYYNIVSTFDTESSSLYKNWALGTFERAKDIALLREQQGLNFNEENYSKIAFTYIWMFLLDDKIIIGRTWEEYKTFINALTKHFNLSFHKRLITYVHNLAFDFQFFRKEFDWSNVFATDMRKVVYATSTDGLEYKCSYFLSNLNLETIGKNLVKYKAEKKVGDLDYDLIRTWKTPLSDKEIEYCLYDVIVLANYIKECMEFEANGLITDIVLTNTGRVRKYCKQYCLSKDNKTEYSAVIKEMNLDVDLYKHLKQAFAGGFTHANALNSMTTIKDVFSVDFTSSYPAVLLLNKYPVGKPCKLRPKSKEQFYKLIKTRACLFTINYYNIRLKDKFNDSIISESKCIKANNPISNNGRLVSADFIQVCITDIDFRAIEHFYDYDTFGIGYFVSYRKDYLPKPLLECILKFYKDKTVLKDVIGEESNYQNKKGMLNSTYGMMATDIFRDVIEYDEKKGWLLSNGDLEECISKYNNSKSRFLSFEWGVWCTAYARYNLFSGLDELKSDFIYADTDSLKFTNYERHKAYFEWYNNTFIPSKIEKVCEARNLNVEDFTPKTIKGKVKMIGVWDLEGKYDLFRTLGAKRYLVKYPKTDEHYNKELDGYSITVSGINKKKALPYLFEESKGKLEDIFDNDLFVGGLHSGKLLHTYIDVPFEDDVTDYLGNTAHVTSKSSVHLEPSSYSLSIVNDYIDYVREIKYSYEKGC